MMKEAMIAIFGEYTTVNGCTDWAYVGAVAIFCICLYSLFRLIGAVFRR